MLATAFGIALVVTGLVGVRYAPEIVEAQRSRGMAPFEDEELETADRVRVTKGTGAAVVLIGLALVGYGVGLV
ncbi:hypothetical protein [Natronococcus wangiae]|uniref:hypothetical protein n=1 Tax=Natronococcus wangiae TaxID=3068275 RepID=UPI00273EAA2E|nr:hypothetical protein [Natronococcus sp. AD5]